MYCCPVCVQADSAVKTLPSAQLSWQSDLSSSADSAAWEGEAGDGSGAGDAGLRLSPPPEDPVGGGTPRERRSLDIPHPRAALTNHLMEKEGCVKEGAQPIVVGQGNV